MPRITLRRTLVYLATATTLSILTFTVTYNAPSGARSGEDDGGIGGGGGQTIQLFKKNLKKPVEEIDEEFLPRFWFMKNGWVRPEPAPVDRKTGQRKAKLWPNEEDNDRILNQLMFVPPPEDIRPPPPTTPPTDDDGTAATDIPANVTVKLKKIVIYHGLANWQPLTPGRDVFLRNSCPVDTCEVTSQHRDVEFADAVLFRDHFSQPVYPRPLNQVWILYMLECPMHTQSFPVGGLFNWTATYRHDSDIVAPYEKFMTYGGVPADPKKVKRRRLKKNYAVGKTGQVAWFVSNCGARNNRLQLAKELAKYIGLDIYGSCGEKQCPRNKADKCFDMLNEKYKFYLSFENSNCRDYITEKFFVNGLGNDVIPIVMGAHREDYERAAPPHSFIHVEDFPTVKELAEYLHLLDKNDTLYNEYFRWKGIGELINTHFWCRVCALLHDRDAPVKVYQDVNEWWRGKGTCVKGRWSDLNKEETSS